MWPVSRGKETILGFFFPFRCIRLCKQQMKFFACVNFFSLLCREIFKELLTEESQLHAVVFCEFSQKITPCFLQ